MFGISKKVLHTFDYLKEHPKRKLAFDPDHLDINEKRFWKVDLSDFYHDTRGH